MDLKINIKSTHDDVKFLQTLDKVSIYRAFIFNQIIRYDSLEVAATVLNIPILKIHAEMRALETFLQDPLILYNHQRITLTSRGKKFADFARILVDNMELIDEKLSNKKDDLVIGCHYGFSEEIIPEVLTKFSQAHPNIRIYMQYSTEYTNLTHNDLDILIGNKLDDLTNLSCIHLKDDPHYLYASTDYIEKFGKPVSSSDFKQHKLLTFINQIYYPDEIFSSNKPYLTTTSMELLYEMVKLGQGIAALPISRIKSTDISDINLIKVANGIECSKDSISFITRNSANKSELINSIHQILIETILKYKN